MDVFWPVFIRQFTKEVTNYTQLIESNDSFLTVSTARQGMLKDLLLAGESQFPTDEIEKYHTPGGLKSGNSEVMIESAIIACISEVTLVANYNILIKGAKYIVADRFGGKSQFKTNMESHGSFFGFNSKNNVFSYPSGNLELDRIIVGNDASASSPDKYYLLSCDRNDKVYAHWLWKILYEVYFALDFLNQFNPILIFTYQPTNQQVQSLLHFFPSLSSARIGIATGKTNFTKIYTSVPPADYVYLDGHYRQFLRKSTHLSTSLGARLYVSRQDARSRRIINNTMVSELLAKYGYTEVVIRDSRIADQATTFSAASHIIYINGSHFCNLIFCQPGTEVCVIAGYGADPIDYYLIHNFGIRGHLYYDEYQEGSTPSHDADLHVDLDKFENYLRQINFL
jgi:hypothetical protein